MAQLTQPAPVEAADVLPGVPQGAGGEPLDAQDDPAQRRLAAAGFADEPDRLTTVQFEIDAVERADRGRVAAAARPRERPRRCPHTVRREADIDFPGSDTSAYGFLGEVVFDDPRRPPA